MSVFRVSDSFHSHPKVLKAGSAATGLWVIMGSWSARYDTKGFIPDCVLKYYDPKHKHAATLVDVGLWRRVNHDQEQGYQFHQWASHQRSDYRANIPDSVRIAVYERDGYRCVACGAHSPLSLDHIWPWSLGGADTFDNLQTLCIPCNCRKGARV